MLLIDSSVSLTSMLNRCFVRESEKYEDTARNWGIPLFTQTLDVSLETFPFFGPERFSTFL